MSAKYLLRCTCGLEVSVEAVQAGQKVTCVCGRQLDVPTMRQMAELDPATPDIPDRSSKQITWGLPHALALLGTLLIVLAIAGVVYLLINRPKPARLEQLTFGQTWQMWEELRRGVNRGPFPDQERYSRAVRSMYVRVGGALLVGILGIAFIAGALLFRRNALHSPSTSTITSSLHPSSMQQATNQSEP